MKRFLLFALAIAGMFVGAYAQIGYQVTVYDQAKKAPKANESVTATVTITDNTGKQIVSETHTGTTDDFGILSMTVGNSNSFRNANWDNLPFWVSATVDGVTISKTQMLTVPVAEYAKQSGGKLTTDILCGKTWHWSRKDYSVEVVFYRNGTGVETRKEYDQENVLPFSYTIDGVWLFCTYQTEGNDTVLGHYDLTSKSLYYRNRMLK